MINIKPIEHRMQADKHIAAAETVKDEMNSISNDYTEEKGRELRTEFFRHCRLAEIHLLAHKEKTR